jgi:hypothetical protein
MAVLSLAISPAARRLPQSWFRWPRRRQPERPSRRLVHRSGHRSSSGHGSGGSQGRPRRRHRQRGRWSPRASPRPWLPWPPRAAGTFHPVVATAIASSRVRISQARINPSSPFRTRAHRRWTPAAVAYTSVPGHPPLQTRLSPSGPGQPALYDGRIAAAFPLLGNHPVTPDGITVAPRRDEGSRRLPRTRSAAWRMRRRSLAGDPEHAG